MERSNSKRIIKNTLSLYIRTAILTVVSLYTSRVVLATLGVDDYGIQNVVGGFVSMFGFISGTLANATQRYFALDLALDDWDKLNKTYSINLAIYLFFIIIILFIAETIGLWFVINILKFDRMRLIAAVVVYECAIIGFVFSLFISPYIALLIADENLSIYSAVSVIEAILKLTVVYGLTVIPYDKLILYSILTSLVGILVNMFFYIYCKYKYRMLKFTLCKEISRYTNVFSFQGWNLIGAIASVLKAQGINIVINVFFGTGLNAARGIAMQVNTAINSFAANFMKAVDPQITKSYGVGDDERFNKLIFSASKMAFALLFVLSVPVIFDAEYILSLWLGEVPEYTVIFVRLALVDAIIYSFTDSIGTGVQSIGKIKVYQIIVGGLLLLNVPLSYLVIKFSGNPLSPFLVAIILSAMGSLGRIICIRRIYSFQVLNYMKNVIIPIIIVTVIIFVASNWFLLPAKYFVDFLVNVIVNVAFSMLLVFVIVLGTEERELVIVGIQKRFCRLKKSK